MKVLEIVLPVLVMIVVGMLCRKWKILTRDGINNMKVLVTNVMLRLLFFMLWQQRNIIKKPES